MAKVKAKRKAKRDYHAEYLRRKTRGRHPGEEAKVGRTYPKRQGRGRKIKKGVTAYPGKFKKPSQKKGRLEKEHEAWAVYSYFDPVRRKGEEGDSDILGITSYDITKTKVKNWDSEPLFLMHQYMERAFAHYFAMVEGVDFELADQQEWNYEQDNDSQKGRKHRGFEWQLTDFVSGDIRYHIKYQEGQIIERDMWEGFDFVQFILEIREQRIWE